MHFLLDPLKDTFLFWIRNFLLLALLTALTVAPEKLLFWSLVLHRHYHGNGGLIVLGVVDIFLKSIQVSALLGLMLLRTNENSIWQAMRSGILAGWWKFMVIYTGISLWTFAVTGNFLAVILHDPQKLGMLKILLAVSFLAMTLGYAKFGLALPVVIVERTSLWAAVKRAWTMTAGDLIWVVVLCLFVIRMVSTACSHLTQTHFTAGHLPSLSQQVSMAVVQAQVDCLFLILLGAVYRKFETREKFLEFFTKLESPSVTTKSAPGSPCDS